MTYNYTSQVYSGVVNTPFFYLSSVDYDGGSHAYYTYNSAGQSDGNPWHIAAGTMKSCDDVRYSGAMKRIRYEYMAVSTAHPEVAWGQLKAEKNWAGQTISEMEYPVYNPNEQSDPGWRKEHRGDGAIRSFQYTGAELSSYTDFLNRTSTIGYGSAPNPDNYSQIFTDARANVTTSEKEGEAGQVIRRTNPGGSMQTFAYEYVDGAPYYLQIRGDELGRNTYFTRDGNHRVSKIWYSYNGDPAAFPTEEFTYNNFGQVLSHKSTTGGTEYFEYDNSTGPATRGLKTKHTDALGNVTRYEYYGWGAHTDRLLRTIDPRGNSTWFEYTLRGQVTKLTHQDGSYAQTGYNPDGTTAWTADELGHTTSYTYDEFKRVLTVTNALNETATNVYAPWNGLGALSHTTGSVYQTISPAGRIVYHDYDLNFRKTLVRAAPGTADDASTSYGYDTVGNLIATTDPRGNVTTFAYDNRNRQTSVTNGLNQTTTVQYDVVSNKIRETRPDNAFRSWDYEQINPMNRLVKTVDWRMSTSEPEVATQYGRNVTSTLETTIDAKGAVYAFESDLLHRKTKETYPPDAAGYSRTENFWYDGASNLIQHKNPNNQYRYIVYDNRNRPSESSWSYGGPAITTTYDAASRVTSIVTRSSPSSTVETTVAFGYDNANRQTSEDQTLAGYPTRRVETPRDADGNRTLLHVPGWYAIRFDHTATNQLAHIYGANWEPWFNYSYDPAGNMTKRQDVMYGVNDSVNVPSQWYDPLNRPVVWEDTGAGDIPYARSWYQYDGAGREVATWRNFDGEKGERFYYSTTNQLTDVSYRADQVWTGTPLHPEKTQQFVYTPDKLNRSSVTENGVVSTYLPNALNQYTSVGGQTIQYDGNFNLNYWGGAILTYDAQNRLVSFNNGNTAQFIYDGLGRCVKRTINGATTVFTYDGWKPIVEWDGTGNFTAWNIYGPRADEILWRYQANYGHIRYHVDRMGNVTSLLDAWGNGIEKYAYDVFGQPTITDWSGNARSTSLYGNRFMFQGREWIGALGIYDYRHRMYHPALGRFLQTDPTGFDAGDMNLFRYCGNDPVNRSDPTGLASGPDDIVKPNLNITGGGDWTQLGSPFTNGDLLSKVQNYLGELKSSVDKYVNMANRESQMTGGNVKWSADYSHWLKSSKEFKNPKATATAKWSAKSEALMNANGTAVASFNINLHIDINWNEGRSRYFGSALRTDTFGLGKTGEIEHPRDALKALTLSYGGSPPARAIANEQAASMVGQSISQEDASSRMDAAFVDWAYKTMRQSRIDRDERGQHVY